MENSLNNQASEIGKYFSYCHIHNCKEELDAGHFKGLRDKPFRVKAQASFLNNFLLPPLPSSTGKHSFFQSICCGHLKRHIILGSDEIKFFTEQVPSKS